MLGDEDGSVAVCLHEPSQTQETVTTWTVVVSMQKGDPPPTSAFMAPATQKNDNETSEEKAEKRDSDDSVTTPNCRICLSRGNQQELVQACACLGTIKHVHQDCLRDWIRRRREFSCEICHTPYSVQMDRHPLLQWKCPMADEDFLDSVFNCFLHLLFLAIFTLCGGFVIMELIKDGTMVGYATVCLLGVFLPLGIVGVVFRIIPQFQHIYWSLLTYNSNLRFHPYKPGKEQ